MEHICEASLTQMLHHHCQLKNAWWHLSSRTHRDKFKGPIILGQLLEACVRQSPHEAIWLTTAIGSDAVQLLLTRQVVEVDFVARFRAWWPKIGGWFDTSWHVRRAANRGCSTTEPVHVQFPAAHVGCGLGTWPDLDAPVSVESSGSIECWLSS
jgi:hypothetical protein